MDYTTSIKPLVIKTNKGDSFFEYNDILRFESDECTCQIHLTNGGVLTTSVKISSLERLLPGNIFFKTHRCHIINLKFVTNLNDKTSIITVAESAIPLSDTYYEEFKKLYNSGDNIRYIH